MLNKILLIILILLNIAIWVTFAYRKENQEEIIVCYRGPDGWAPIVQQPDFSVKQCDETTYIVKQKVVE